MRIAQMPTDGAFYGCFASMQIEEFAFDDCKHVARPGRATDVCAEHPERLGQSDQPAGAKTAKYRKHLNIRNAEMDAIFNF